MISPRVDSRVEYSSTSARFRRINGHRVRAHSPHRHSPTLTWLVVRSRTVASEVATGRPVSGFRPALPGKWCPPSSPEMPSASFSTRSRISWRFKTPVMAETIRLLAAQFFVHFRNIFFDPLALSDSFVGAQNPDDVIINVTERDFAGPQPDSFAIRRGLGFLVAQTWECRSA